MSQVFWAFALIVGLSVPVAAEVALPALYRVVGVAADDVLNIRIEPRAGATKIGELPPDAVGVEVIALSESGRWGMIATLEGNGWVSMGYLALDNSAGAGFPRPMVCRGTEPFWSLRLAEDEDRFLWVGEEPANLTTQDEQEVAGGYLLSMTDETGVLHDLTITRAECSDGMSDRRFGWSAAMRVNGPTGPEALQGCCSLDQR